MQSSDLTVETQKGAEPQNLDDEKTKIFEDKSPEKTRQASSAAPKYDIERDEK